MVADAGRNAAYRRAIEAAVARARARLAPGEPLAAVDLGAGSGLLAMMAARWAGSWGSAAALRPRSLLPRRRRPALSSGGWEPRAPLRCRRLCCRRPRRAGADEVFAIESVGHLADTAQLVAALNGHATSVRLVHKDARFVTAASGDGGGGSGAGPAGGGGGAPPPELPRRAQLAVFELFDCGCIGEGVLHVLAAARAQLLAPGAEVVPRRAAVRCQPGQLRRLGRTAQGLDVRLLNQYHWLPDYEEVDLPLGLANGQWRPAAAPQLLFEFDFGGGAEQLQRAFQPAERLLRFEVGPGAPSVINCVAFWMELDLGGGEVLSCCPGGGASGGSTWQQAAQFVEEVEVAGGGVLAVRGHHDTYGISFELLPGEGPSGGGGGLADLADGGGAGGAGGGASGGALPAGSGAGGPSPTGVPLFEPSWRAQYEALARVGSELGRASAQDPLRYRQLAQLALQLACRPAEQGVDAAQAAAFCVRMLS
jgi:hypothetical protein